MQREIKFRAWDKSKKEMIYYPLWSTLHDRHVLYFSKINDSYVDEMDNNTSLQLMQFTGLKDKNGKEIYEGDVVEYKNPVFTSDIRKDRVEWDEWYAGFDPFCNHGVDISYKIDGLDVGIIGNIYENPALLSNPQ